MKITEKSLLHCFVLMSFENKSFVPLFNPESEDRFSDPVLRLTPKFILSDGFDKTKGPALKLSPFTAEELVGKSFKDVLSDLVAIWRHKDNRNQKWVFQRPNVKIAEKTESLDQLDAIEESTETMVVTLEDLADVVEALYMSGSGNWTTPDIVVSGQCRTTGLIGYLAYLAKVKELDGKLDATEKRDFIRDAAKTIKLPTVQATSKTVSGLALEVIKDNQRNTADYPESSLPRIWNSVRRENMRLSTRQAADEIGHPALFDNLGKPKNGITEKLNGIFRLCNRHPHLNIESRIVAKVNKDTPYTGGDSKIEYRRLSRQDMRWLTCDVTESTKPTTTIKALFRAFDVDTDSYRKAGHPAPKGMVEAWLELIQYGTIQGTDQSNLKKKGQALGKDDLDKIQKILKDTAMESFEMSLYEVIELVASGDLDGLIDAIQESTKPKVKA